MPPSCACNDCVSACKQRPGWFMPGEAERAAMTGITIRYEKETIMQDPKNLLNVKKYKHFLVAISGDIIAGHEYLTRANNDAESRRISCKVQSRYFCERMMNR